MAEKLPFDFCRRKEAFLSSASTPPLVLIRPAIQRVTGVLLLEVKRPGLEADHSPISRVGVKNTYKDLYFQSPYIFVP
jgi:hypothetical protein